MELAEKSRFKAPPGYLVKGEGHPMLNMDVDFLKNLELENIHMRIATGKIVEEYRLEMEEVMTMPTELKKKMATE
jgi:hypothetical protein